MRRAPLKLVAPPDRSAEPGYRAWKTPAWGACACCSEKGRLERHHVISEQHVRAVSGNPWDLANSLLLGVHCRCHREHTSAARRLPCSIIPAQAIEFATRLLGAGPADLYFDRYYAPR